MIINKALKKHKHCNFSLEILEYCEPSNVISREQYYLDLLKPEYNILKIAGSSLGFKHTEETLIQMRNRKHSVKTKAIMSEAKKGENHPLFGKTCSEETKSKISEARKGQKILEETKAKMSAKKGTLVKVLDFETNETITYSSINKAAKALGVSQQRLSYHFQETNSFILKDRYQLDKLKID